MEDFAPYELAVKLKEKGFPQRPDNFNYSNYYDWDGLRKTHSLSNASVWFDPNISRDNICFAPTISQVLKWLRKEKGMHICIDIYDDGWFFDVTHFYEADTGVYEIEFPYISSNVTPDYQSYELAALAGIEYVLDNLI